MKIEEAPIELLKNLTFGSFPQNVTEFQYLQHYIEQIVFIDYQLQSYIHSEFHGSVFEVNDFESLNREENNRRLSLLIEHLKLIDANYNQSIKNFYETLYYTTVLAHLYYLNSQISDLVNVTSMVYINNQSKSGSSKTCVDEFINYVTTRFKVIQGFADEQKATSIWNEYLILWEPSYFNKSNIAAHRWLDILFDRFAYFLSMEHSTSLDFQTVRQAPFSSSKSLLIAFCNYLCRHKNKDKVTASFKKEFGGWLTKVFEKGIVSNNDTFPSAKSTDTSNELNAFIDNIFEGIGSIPYYYTILKPSLAKTFLEDAMKKTYQSQTVLSSFIKTLLDLKEYDEAFAAFKAYVNYVHEDSLQHGGNIDNILGVIDVYNACLLSFNPSEVFGAKKNDSSKRRFKYLDRHEVVQSLLKFSSELIALLESVAKICEISYTQEALVNEQILKKRTDDEEELSFLYSRRNTNILASDRSYFVDLISKSWFAVAKLYMYMAVYEASNEEQVKQYTDKILDYHKRALVINSTGNVEILFSYAYSLANTGSLNLAIKLCKFILKKYPESFKTWNLLVLLVTLFENHNPDKQKPPKTADEEFQNHIESTIEEEEEEEILYDLEKLINNALNIAGLFIEKYSDKVSTLLPEETKYQIIQLKITQVAVKEAIHGSNYILESLADVFELFHELFYIDMDSLKGSSSKEQNVKTSSNKAAWSHRPSILDPKLINETTRISKTKSRLFELDNIGEKIKKFGQNKSLKTKSMVLSGEKKSYYNERRLLQELWLWASGVYAKNGDLEDAEQCIVEAETIFGPNVKTHAYFGFLISKSRKFLSLQEFEKSLETLTEVSSSNKREVGLTLLGMCKLFLLDDEPGNSLFLLETDMTAGLVRMKNFLESYTYSWPYGSNNSEVWWYLSLIYEKIDDKLLLNKSLWKSIELEEYRPVRDFTVCLPFELT